MRDDVKKLAGSTLRNPFMIKELFDPMAPKTSLPSTMDGDNSMPLLQAPSQLTQKYVIVPLKLRLVSLVALMRSLLANTKTKRGGGAKIIVFFSCTDSVDWHMDAFGTWGADSPKTEGMEGLDGEDSPEDNKDDDPEGKTKKRKPGNGTSSKSPLLPNTTIHKLHGNLSTALRLASLSAFSASSSNGENKILFTTSLSSRGLSIPSVGAIVQYDLPTEGGMNEYIHRVGRTARLGAEGESWCFLSPSEDGWVAWAKQQVGAGGLKLNQGTVEGLLRTGFTPTLKGKGKDYEQRATEVQLGFERAVLKVTLFFCCCGVDVYSSFVRTRKLRRQRSLHMSRRTPHIQVPKNIFSTFGKLSLNNSYHARSCHGVLGIFTLDIWPKALVYEKLHPVYSPPTPKRPKGWQNNPARSGTNLLQVILRIPLRMKVAPRGRGKNVMVWRRRE